MSVTRGAARIFQQLMLALKTEFDLKFFKPGGVDRPPDSYAYGRVVYYVNKLYFWSFPVVLCCMLGIERNLSPHLSQTECTPKQSKRFTKWFFYFQNKNTTNQISITLRGAANRHKHENKVKRQHFFHFQNKSWTSTMMGNVCFRCCHSVNIRKYY